MLKEKYSVIGYYSRVNSTEDTTTVKLAARHAILSYF